MTVEFLIAVVTGTVVAATPLIYAALGELVAERAGVLNLGVEGMMLVGALAAFAVSVSTGRISPSGSDSGDSPTLMLDTGGSRCSPVKNTTINRAPTRNSGIALATSAGIEMR